MARPHLPVGVPAHVILRAHNELAVFDLPADRELFLVWLQNAAARSEVLIHAFAIMATHAHAIVTPAAEGAVPRMIRLAAGRYARYFNRRYERSGALWNSRYRAFVLDTDRYFFTCLRYVERNPVAAGLVEHLHEYPWTSYAAHGLGAWPAWLTPHPLYVALGSSPAERQTAYRAMCEEPLTDEEIAWLRYVIDRDWPYGTIAYQRSATILTPGRS